MFSFNSTPVPDEVLYRISQDINLCPTAGNIQVKRAFSFLTVPVISRVYREKPEAHRKTHKSRRTGMDTTGGLCRIPLTIGALCICVLLRLQRPLLRKAWSGTVQYSRCDDRPDFRHHFLPEGRTEWDEVGARSIVESCWVGSFDESEVSSILNIPSHLRPIGMLPCGYSEAPPRHERSRRDLDETFTYC